MKKGILILSMIFSLAAFATSQAVEASTVPEALTTVSSQTETLAPATVELEQAGEQEKEGFDWLAIINAGLFVVVLFFGRGWLLTRGKFQELIKLSQSAVNAGKAIDKALDDGNITEEEKNELRIVFGVVKGDWEAFVNFEKNAGQTNS